MVAVKVLDDADIIGEFSQKFVENDSRLDVLEKYGIYASLVDLKNAKAGNFPYSLLTEAAPIEYIYTLGDFTGKTDDVNRIALNNTPITTGALVRRTSKGIGFQQYESTNFIDVNSKLGERISVDDYIYPGDTNDLPAFNRARAALIKLGGGSMYCKSRKYTLNGTFVLSSGFYDIPLMLSCEKGTILFGNHTGAVINVGGSMYLRGGGIVGDPMITNIATGGNLIEFGQSGCTECVFQVSLDQQNPNSRLIYAPQGEVYDSRFWGSRWTTKLTHTVAPVEMISQGTTVNGNSFSPRRCYNATATQFFRFTNNDLTTWLVNNTFDSITFEICKGGAIKYTNARGWTFRNLSFWDAGVGGYTNHILWGAINSGYKSTCNYFENCIRNGDTLAANICDIYLQADTHSTVSGCFNEASNGPRYDWNNNIVFVLGLMYGEVNSNGRAIINGGQLVIQEGGIYGAAVYGDVSLSLGGIDRTETMRMYVGAEYVSHDILNGNATGFLWSTRGTDGTVVKLVLGAATASTDAVLSPVTDNKMTLGQASMRFKEVFAANAVINTSDATLKKWRGPLNEAEIAAGNEIADNIGIYQWLDAIALKGDNARLHTGVLAQGVIAIMEAHGLDPFAYSFVCFDSWEQKDAQVSEQVVIPAQTGITDGDGKTVIEDVPEKILIDQVEIIPAQQAGSRYGIRTGELALFVMAAQHSTLKNIQLQIDVLNKK